MKSNKEIPEKNLNVIIYALISRVKHKFNKIISYNEAKVIAMDKVINHKGITIRQYLLLKPL